MINPDSRIPDYLTGKGNTIRMIVFTAVFALVFINTYSPFGIELMYDLTELELLLWSSAVIIAGVLIVVISRVIMIRISRKYSLRIWQYLLWVLAEIIFMGLFYFLIERIVLNDPRDIYDLIRNTIRNTALVLLLPYTLSWLYFAWKDKTRQLEGLSGKPGTSEGREKRMIAFKDDKGVLRISLRLESIAFIEANENYVNITYTDNGNIKTYVLRSTLKKMEDILWDMNFARCHRKYLVNFHRVKILKREKSGLLIEFDIPGSKELPVSATYADNVMSLFTRNYL
ncbi:MAG: LytTR family transcriptional regulator [Bacteroidales bacterium]|nr:LytTR family transcriptional regulator [Bacteroidales bacterium]